MPGYKTVTGMGGTGGAADLAEMLRQMGRGRDTVLAHITPEEAEMLMQMGGSGDMNPNTGLPEFQPVYDDYTGEFFPQQPMFQQAPQFTPAPGSFQAALPEFGVTPRSQEPQMSFRGQPQPKMDFQTFDLGFGPGRYAPEYTRADVAGMAPEQFDRFQPPQPSPFARLAGAIEGGVGEVRQFASDYPNVAKLLSVTGQSLPALLSAARARREGGRAADELRALGRPLREEAENLRAQALAGGLTPQQAREQEAARARLRQQAATRGATTGTQQAMIDTQLQRARSEMGQVNLQNALRQLNLANAYDEEAIRIKLSADRDISNRIANIIGNIGRQFGSMAPEGGQTQEQSQPETPRQPVTQRPQIRD
jgi:hypothetical protein